MAHGMFENFLLFTSFSSFYHHYLSFLIVSCLSFPSSFSPDAPFFILPYLVLILLLTLILFPFFLWLIPLLFLLNLYLLLPLLLPLNFPPCSFPWFSTCFFLCSCYPVLSPDWRYRWDLWSLPDWWKFIWEAAKHEDSRIGLTSIFRMPKQSHLKANNK